MFHSNKCHLIWHATQPWDNVPHSNFFYLFANLMKNLVSSTAEQNTWLTVWQNQQTMTAHSRDTVCSFTAQGGRDTFGREELWEAVGMWKCRIQKTRWHFCCEDKDINDLGCMVVISRNEHNLRLLLISRAPLQMSCQDTMQIKNIGQDIEYLWSQEQCA